MKPLTTEQIEAIRERAVGSERSYDVSALVNEIDRVANQLSDCWLFIDALARHQVNDDHVPQLAKALLTKQEAPGWKPTGRKS